MDIRYWPFDMRQMYTGADAIDIMQNCTIESLTKTGEFMVATGILAKDGTMIYEGDMIRADIPVGPLDGMYSTFEFIVEYQPARGGFNVDKYCENVEIIGDKYNGPFE